MDYFSPESAFHKVRLRKIWELAIAKKSSNNSNINDNNNNISHNNNSNNKDDENDEWVKYWVGI